MNDWAIKYNDGLKSALEGLKSELKNFNYSYFDTYAVLQNLVQQPASYGTNIFVLFASQNFGTTHNFL